MEVKFEPKFKIGSVDNTKINLDCNDYIIMRKGIEPIWEDPKNSKGGTFTIRMIHSKGYDVWSTFIMYMLGEKMTYEMHNINGITVSYISDSNSFHNPIPSNNKSYTYIKIWDAKSQRTQDQFINILPIDLYNKIKNESIRYSPNNSKVDFEKEAILKNLNTNNHGNTTRKNSYNNNRDRGGFSAHSKKY